MEWSTATGMEPHLAAAVRHLQTALFAVELEQHTLGEAIERYRLQHLLVDGLSPNTIAWREAALRVLARWADRPIAGAWRDVGAALYAEARAAGLKESVASLRCNTLARILNLAKSWGWRFDDHDLKGICRVRAGKRRVQLRSADMEAIGAALVELGERERLRVAADAVRLVALTGMRVGEAAGLRWCDVDLGQALVRLPDSKTGPRDVELAPPAIELLRMQRSRGRSSWVFPRRRGDGPLNRRQVLHALQAACERAHVPATVVHALRHHFATVGVQLDLPTTPMSLALGHSTEWQTTEYQHARRDDVRRAVAKVAGHVAAQLAGKAGAR